MGSLKTIFRRILISIFIVSFFSSCLPSGSQGKNKKIFSRSSVTDDENENTDEEIPTEDTNAKARPDKVISIDPDYCACFEKKAVILNNCDAFCADKNLNVPTLYLNFTPGPEISEDERFQSTRGWCNNVLEEGSTSPSCKIFGSDGFNEVGFDILYTGDNSISINMEKMNVNTTYIIKLREIDSQSESQSVQVRRIEPDTTSSEPQPQLKIAPIHLYACLRLAGSKSGTDTYYDYKVKSHYFFPDGNNPEELSKEEGEFVKCHDHQKYTSYDSPLYPRLDLIEHYFYLWSKKDIRFADLAPKDDVLDINKLVEERLNSEYSIESTINIFSEFKYLNSPVGENSNITQGYLMQSWLDSTNNTAFCPTQEDYNSDQPIFKILKDYIGVDTEALYLAKREKLKFLDANGDFQDYTADFIFIREGLVEQLWFYHENGLHIKPDSFSRHNKTLRFYWPADTTSPYIQKSHQLIYTIVSSTGESTNFPSSDNRLGCIPAIGE